MAPAYAYIPTAHAVCEAGVAHALPAAHCVVSLAEPGGQKLPAVVHARQSPAAWKVAPPSEYVPMGHCTPAGAPEPGQ